MGGDPFREGELIAGKYRVERAIGSGGMGIVIAARHLALDQLVAIKFLKAESLLDSDVVERFAREGRAVAKIESEHVARVMDVAYLDGAPYLVMEHLEGKDLATVLAEQGALPLADVARYVREACSALVEAHAEGIIHRDLKPANLFLARRKNDRVVLKVLDFGISKSVTTADIDVALTSTGTVLGSPLYMSPEQIKKPRDVDVRTDVWSLGVILYQLSAGHLPFGGESLGALIGAILHEAPIPLRTRRPALPEAFESVVLRCLAKDPSERVQTIAELRDLLLPFESVSIRPTDEAINALATTEPGSDGPSAVLDTPPVRTDPEKTLRAAEAPEGIARAREGGHEDEKSLERTHRVSAWGTTSPDVKTTSPRGRAVVLLGFGALVAVGGVFMMARSNDRSPSHNPPIIPDARVDLVPSAAPSTTASSAPITSVAIAPSVTASTSAAATMPTTKPSARIPMRVDAGAVTPSTATTATAAESSGGLPTLKPH